MIDSSPADFRKEAEEYVRQADAWQNRPLIGRMRATSADCGTTAGSSFSWSSASRVSTCGRTR
jgi:hypothetical protein